MRSDLVELVVELHQLGAAERRALLDRFEPHERELIGHYLAKAVRPAPPKFDALATLSPWLADSLSQARGPQPCFTAATREALIESERLLPRAAAEAPDRPSLAGRILALGRRR